MPSHRSPPTPNCCYAVSVAAPNRWLLVFQLILPALSAHQPPGIAAQPLSNRGVSPPPEHSHDSSDNSLPQRWSARPSLHPIEASSAIPPSLKAIPPRRAMSSISILGS